MLDSLNTSIENNNLISLISLMKAYFLMVLPYFEIFIQKETTRISIKSKENLLQDIQNVRSKWLSFFVQFLSAIESPTCSLQ